MTAINEEQLDHSAAEDLVCAWLDHNGNISRIAQVLGKTENNVRVRLHYLRRLGVRLPKQRHRESSIDVARLNRIIRLYREGKVE